MLSILIPVYNFDCSKLVKDLHRLTLQEQIAFEIIVLDDVSTHFISENSKINGLPFARFEIAKTHLGRAKIRNVLGGMAKGEMLLFIDADAEVANEKYIHNYLQFNDKADVIIGGTKYAVHPPDKQQLLRWKYGKNREEVIAKTRNKHPYHSITSFNIFMKSTVFKNCNFDEESISNESSYGHEDTLLGIKYMKENISVWHINNALIHNDKASSKVFLKNGLIAVEKYIKFAQFRKQEVVKQIKIFRVFEECKKWGGVGLLSLIYRNLGKKMQNQLLSKSPLLFLFDLYRLCYLADFYKKNRDQIN